MKKIIILLLLILPISIYAGRAHESAEKADRECKTFYEWLSGKSDNNSRAHKSAERVFEE